MIDIKKIVLKSDSGLWVCDAYYNNKITITPKSIAYQYKLSSAWITPNDFEDKVIEEIKWSYKVISNNFKNLYEQISKKLWQIHEKQDALDNRNFRGFTITVIITLSDGQKITQEYLNLDCFEECFKLIEQMIPSCEEKPQLLTDFYQTNYK